jgi:hypothetical protein
MPPLATELRREVVNSLDLATAAETIRGEPDWGLARIELLYEFAFLRVFLGWEQYLEKTFLRYLCGYQSTLGVCTPVPGTVPFPTLATDEAALLGARQYVLWHKPSTVITRARQFWSASFHELVVQSNQPRLEYMASVRHRIVHAQDDAIRNFDQATMALAGRRYRGARPGRFLRDWNIGVSPQERWLVTLSNELASLSAQIS